MRYRDGSIHAFAQSFIKIYHARFTCTCSPLRTWNHLRNIPKAPLPWPFHNPSALSISQKNIAFSPWPYRNFHSYNRENSTARASALCNFQQSSNIAFTLDPMKTSSHMHHRPRIFECERIHITSLPITNNISIHHHYVARSSSDVSNNCLGHSISLTLPRKYAVHTHGSLTSTAPSNTFPPHDGYSATSRL